MTDDDDLAADLRYRLGQTNLRLEETETRLGHALAQLAAIADVAADGVAEPGGGDVGVILYGPDGAALAANPDAVRIFGLRHYDLSLDSRDWKRARAERTETPTGRRVPPDELPVARALATGESVHDFLGVEDVEGRRVWIAVRAIGHPGVAAVETFTEITRRTARRLRFGNGAT